MKLSIASLVFIRHHLYQGTQVLQILNRASPDLTFPSGNIDQRVLQSKLFEKNFNMRFNKASPLLRYKPLGVLDVRGIVFFFLQKFGSEIRIAVLSKL